jgi:hypothetical protein
MKKVTFPEYPASVSNFEKYFAKLTPEQKADKYDKDGSIANLLQKCREDGCMVTLNNLEETVSPVHSKSIMTTHDDSPKRKLQELPVITVSDKRPRLSEEDEEPKKVPMDVGAFVNQLQALLTMEERMDRLSAVVARNALGPGRDNRDRLDEIDKQLAELKASVKAIHVRLEQLDGDNCRDEKGQRKGMIWFVYAMSKVIAKLFPNEVKANQEEFSRKQ